MRIIAYGCREDEVPVFEELKKSGNMDLVVTTEHLDHSTAELARGADGVSIEGQCRADREILEQLASMGIRSLSTRTVGYNQIDLEAAAELGIRCANVSYSPYGVANYTVLLMLASIRKFLHLMARSQVMDYSLRGVQGRELQNMTVGIVGMGKIGRAVARCLSGFGCTIIAAAHHPTEEAEQLAEIVSLEELYARADIVTLHVPLREDNYHMIDAAALSIMKDGVILINTARGELIDTEALIEAMESEKVGAVGIDTFENEREIIHIDHAANLIHNRNLLAIKAYPNAIVSPHAAFFTDQASRDMVTCSVQTLTDWYEGRDNPHEIHIR